MKFNRALTTAAGLLLLLSVLSACGSSGNPTSSSGAPPSSSGSSGASGAPATSGTSASSSGPVKIAVVQEAEPSVDPWAHAFYTSLEGVHAANSNISFSQVYNGNTPSAAQQDVQTYLSDGYKVIIFGTYVLNDVAHHFQPLYKKVPMVVTGFQGARQPNLSVGTADYLQIGYANCWLLTELASDGTIGYIGGEPAPFDTDLKAGCKIGADAANPHVKILTAYTESFSNDQANAQEVEDLSNEGAKNIFLASGETDDLGGFGYCARTGVNCETWGSSASTWDSKTGIMSIDIDWAPMIQKLVAQANSGKLDAYTFDASFGNGGLVAQPFTGATGARVPASIQAKFDAMLKQLASGAIKLPKSKAHPGFP